MASWALAVPDPNAAWPGRFVATWLAHMGPLVGRGLHSNRVTPWSASMQDETLTVDMTPSAVRRLALGVSARLQGLARLFEQLETAGLLLRAWPHDGDLGHVRVAGGAGRVVARALTLPG
jgi:hypothetical protein